MNICNFCGEPVKHLSGCKGGLIKVDGRILPRVRYSSEASTRCPDCCCKPGSFHHVGCIEELCPVCNNKRIGCQCGR